MLDRLHELANAANIPPGTDDEVVSDDALATSPFEELLSGSDSLRGVFTDIRARLNIMRAISADMSDGQLPTRLQELTAQFSTEDQHCQLLVCRTKQRIAALRGELQSENRSLNRARENLIRCLAADLHSLVQELFNIRRMNLEDVRRRTQRQLRIAYPDAAESTFQDTLDNLDIAATAISMRAEGFVDVEEPSLDVVLRELESKRTDAKKLEESASELKSMFMHFSALIDDQGETFNFIESNIETTADKTDKAHDNLVMASGYKRSADARRHMMWMIAGIIGMILMVWFGGGTLLSLVKSAATGEPDGQQPGSVPEPSHVPIDNSVSRGKNKVVRSEKVLGPSQRDEHGGITDDARPSIQSRTKETPDPQLSSNSELNVRTGTKPHQQQEHGAQGDSQSHTVKLSRKAGMRREVLLDAGGHVLSRARS